MIFASQALGVNGRGFGKAHNCCVTTLTTYRSPLCPIFGSHFIFTCFGLFLPSSLFQVPARQCSYLLTPFSSFSQGYVFLSTSIGIGWARLRLVCVGVTRG